MAADGKNVYLVKLGPKSFGDGRQDICKDKASNLGPAAEDFVIWNFFSVHFRREYSMCYKGITSGYGTR